MSQYNLSGIHDPTDYVPLMQYGQAKSISEVTTSELYERNKSNSNYASVGKPSRRSRLSWDDLLSILITLFCYALGIASILVGRVAVWLGQTNQLVVLGAVLSIMGFFAFKQIQSLMLVLESKTNSPRLQNFDAILRDEKFGSKTSLSVRTVLIFLFALPLALSAAYKQFVGGRTTIDTTADNILPPENRGQSLLFGPSSPPGLFSAGGRNAFMNATTGLFANGSDILRSDPPSDSSYGYNMHVINETVTAMLDMPWHTNMSLLQSTLDRNKVLTISADVGATFSRLNSTPDSPERQNSEYWENLERRIGGQNGGFQLKGIGYGIYFGMWNNFADATLLVTGAWNGSHNESIYKTGLAFNNYRGTARGTWRITSGSIELVSATNFDTNYDSAQDFPEVTWDGAEPKCQWDQANTNPEQKAIYCGWDALGLDYLSSYFTWVMGAGGEQGWTPSPPSVWVAVTASMMWAVVVNKVESYGVIAPRFQYLLTTPKYEMKLTVPTMHTSWALYAILAVQPLLLLFAMLTRLFLHPAPVSQTFGMVSLLAGVNRASLDVIKGASFSGELRKPVYVHIVEQLYTEPGSKRSKHPVIEYQLCSKDTVCQYCNESVPTRQVYQQVPGSYGDRSPYPSGPIQQVY